MLLLDVFSVTVSFFGAIEFFELLLLGGTIELIFNLTFREEEEEGSEVEIPGLWDPDLCLVRRRSNCWSSSPASSLPGSGFLLFSCSASKPAPASNWPVTGLISNGCLASNDCVAEVEEEDMLSLFTKDLGPGEEISPVSIQRSSAGEVRATVDLGTGLRVTPEFGGGIREALQSF